MKIVYTVLFLAMAGSALAQDLFEVIRIGSSTGRKPDISFDNTHILVPALSGKVDLQDLVSGTVIESFDGLWGVFSSTGNRLAVVAETTVGVVDSLSQKVVRDFDFAPSEVVAAQLTPNGDVLFVMINTEVDDTEHWVYAFDVEDGSKLWSTLAGVNGQDESLAISQDGTKLAMGMTNSNLINVVSPATGDPLVPPFSVSHFSNLIFSADSSYLMICTQSGVRVHDSSTGAFIRILSHTNSSAFSSSRLTPHAISYASSFQADIYQMWNTDTWQNIGDFKGFSVQGSDPKMSDDGRFIVYTHGPTWGNGKVYVVKNPGRTANRVPSVMTIVSGDLISGTVTSTHDSDNNELRLRPGIVFTSSLNPIEVQVEATMPSVTPNELRFIVQSSASTGPVKQTVQFYNYSLQQFVVGDVRLGFGSAHITVVAGPSADYIEPGTHRVKARIGFRLSGPIFVYPWEAKINYVSWRAD